MGPLGLVGLFVCLAFLSENQQWAPYFMFQAQPTVLRFFQPPLDKIMLESSEEPIHDLIASLGVVRLLEKLISKPFLLSHPLSS